jgi:hypothetical protein
MAEAFTAITTEIYINGAWADVTSDVLISPSPRVSGIGIMGNSINDRTGDVGTYEFSLDNSQGNSAATLGYYTPEGVNKRTGWTQGLPVRLSFTYDGYKRYKFYGTIDKDGITPDTGKYGKRSVKIKCSNWMARATDHTLTLMQYQTSFRGDQGIQCVLDNMTFKPQSVSLGQGASTYPTVFDVTRNNTKALGEINKLTMSGLDYSFMRGDDATGEQFVFMPRSAWVAKAAVATFPAKNSDFTDSILQESGGTDDILLEDGGRLLQEHSTDATFNVSAKDNMIDLKVSYGKNMANHVVMKTYPRKLDTSSQVLWALETPITIAAGETLTETRGTYTDPNSGSAQIGGTSMVSPVATTDYQMWSNTDGLTGVDHTAELTVVAEYGTSEVRYTLTNTGAATYYIGKLQARGIGVYIYDPAEKVYDSTTQQATFGVIPLTIDMPYLDGISNLFTIAEKTPGGFFNGGLGTQLDKAMLTVDKIIFNVNRTSQLMMAFLFMEPSDTMKLYETVTDDGGGSTYVYWLTAWYITGYDFEIIDGKFVKWSPVLKYAGLT